MICNICYFCVLVLILQNVFVCAVEIKGNLKAEMNQMEKLMKKDPDKKSSPEVPIQKPPKRWKYKDYIRKFDAATIYERVQRRYKRAGKNISQDAIFEEMMAGIDPTDELLRFKVDKTNWGQLYGPEFRRAYLPPGTYSARTKNKKKGDWGHRQWVPDRDLYGVRPRIFELMKQVIYQARDKMTYMQKLREELNHSAVFRMGFLFAKTDQKIKDYHKMIFKSFILCNYVRMYITRKVDILEVLSGYERAIMHWFEAELLWDLINRNDRICKQVIKTYYSNRKEEFNKVYID